jgi:cystathionine beta-synthase
MYNDYWLLEQGLFKRKLYGDLRDIISRRFENNQTVFVGISDTLNTAYKRMKTYDVSQLPVILNGKVVGIVDESDLMLALYSNGFTMNNFVQDIMTKDLKTIKYTESIGALVDILNSGLVVIVEDENNLFQGLITKIDLINYLRNKK